MSNMHSLSLLSGVLALSQVVASTLPPATKQCVQLEVPVSVVATNRQYSMPRVDSTIDAIDWTVNVTTRSEPSAEDRTIRLLPIKSTFKISAQLCVPLQRGAKANILQIATHGLGFDKRYWDVEINPAEYSYVDAAVGKGYSILTYDRLGTGKSEKPNAYDVVQIPTEVEIIAGLTKLARSGKLISSSKVVSRSVEAGDNNTTPLSSFRPSKVVQVGHSFGAYLIALNLAKYGNLTDGAILSGLLTTNLTTMIDVLHYDHEFARQHDPVRFGGYGSGYFVLNTQSCLQKLFLRKGAFEPQMLPYVEKIKSPEAVGEYASEGTNPFQTAHDFTGPLQFFNGEFDNFICIGDCRGIYNETAARVLFPGVPKEDLVSYLQPNTGHALTVATNASAGYQVMLQFLDSRRL